MEQNESFGHSKYPGEPSSARKEYNQKQTEALSILKNLRTKVQQAIFDNTVGPKEVEKFDKRCSPPREKNRFTNEYESGDARDSLDTPVRLVPSCLRLMHCTWTNSRCSCMYHYAALTLVPNSGEGEVGGNESAVR